MNIAKKYLLVCLLLWKGVQGQEPQGMVHRITERNFDPSTLMWYDQPAQKWEDALPLGNGRLGAMVFGKVDEEIIQFNEDTYWSGGPYSTVVKGGADKLPEIQQLVFDGKYFEAQKAFGRHLMGYPIEQQKYQSLGNLHIFFPDSPSDAGDQHYVRWLDLEQGLAGVSYQVGDVQYQREIFASAPDQAIIVRITANKPKQVSFSVNLRGERNQAHSNYATDYFRMDSEEPDMLVLTGKSADYMGVTGSLKYEVRLKAFADNGSVRVEGEDLIVEDADAVTLCLVAATNFVNYQDVTGNPHQRVIDYLASLEKRSYAQLRDRHISDYQALFGRVALTLETTDQSFETTDRRIKGLKTGADPQLASLGYQFGRYVLMSSSRPGTQPANLQGIWNKDMNPWWDSKYTTNINTEMNYWIAESGNLSECTAPLFQMISELTDQGSQVAREHYGARGWVFHQNTDLWRVAAPMDGSTWGTFTVGGAWLTTHLWEHFLYNPDTAYLRNVYPIIKGSVDFFMDFLIEDPKNGWLVTNPSNSPENFPGRPGNGPYFDEVTAGFRPGTNVCAGSTIDMQILSDLFSYYAAASNVLDIDQDYAKKVMAAQKRLVPPLIGKDGTLQEWAQDWEQTEFPHRHLSHLYGLYPGNVLSVEKTPEMMQAVRKALEQRGDTSHGNSAWSMAWKIPLWARMKDAEQAHKMAHLYLKRHVYCQLFTANPMQVDGTLGFAAGVSEMLMQSHSGFIELLPACPKEWDTGTFTGIRARGGFELGFNWRDGKVDEMTVRSTSGKVCRLKPFADRMRIEKDGKKVPVRKHDDGTISFQTIIGGEYTIQRL